MRSPQVSQSADTVAKILLGLLGLIILTYAFIKYKITVSSGCSFILGPTLDDKWIVYSMLLLLAYPFGLLLDGVANYFQKLLSMRIKKIIFHSGFSKEVLAKLDISANDTKEHTIQRFYLCYDKLQTSTSDTGIDSSVPVHKLRIESRFCTASGILFLFVVICHFFLEPFQNSIYNNIDRYLFSILTILALCCGLHKYQNFVRLVINLNFLSKY